MPLPLFVYGTLHPDRAPAELRPIVARFVQVSTATIQGTLLDIGDYPGVIGGTDLIAGTLFTIDPADLPALDAYEGFDPASPTTSLFLRVRRTVALPDGNYSRCWVYLYNRPFPHNHSYSRPL